ncbi:MAG: PEP-utilizing enzyme [Candidatus Paceibacterota bacterium]|jgi:phosphohistidine swiveling domain-containing protein
MSLKFQKMWSAGIMGAGVGEQAISYNFSHNTKLKKHCGVVEKNALFYFEKSVGTQFYFEVSEMEEAADFGFKRFTNKTKTQKYIEDSKKAIEISDNSYNDFLKINIKSLTFQDLFKLYKEKLRAYEESYSIYHACQPQYVRNIEKYVQGILEERYGKDLTDNIYSTLLLSDELDSLSSEHLEWLQIVKELKDKYSQEKVFTEKNLTKEETIKIENHSRKYIYLGTVETNNPWNFDYYIRRLNRDIKSNFDEDYIDLIDKQKDSKDRKDKIIDKYKLSKKIVDICNNLSRIGLIRLQIRFAWTKSAYVLGLITSELAEKSVDQRINKDSIVQYRLDELENAVKYNKYLSEEELKNREEAYLFLSKNLISDYGDKVHFYSGKAAVEKMNELFTEVASSKGGIKGTIACKGKVIGRVVKFSWIEKELNKKMEMMKEGDILVAGQTRPFLMPAIRKAGAIVTDEGGITCHAAIVSRELKIPCIIDTKIATKMLKDGDMVEVDANNGVVKIVKQ